ncbi:unnamed protein product [Protopolystoma xenopodis]|uniref:PDZ domain-containing protein n=1 Tax=Protopolystoma xenopodis TaxID=117903 RepID=A0A3S5CLF7_9PLAT|nr:unnamed protein product [Protopolystoma xenopodis]
MPALQYLEQIEENSVAYRAGLRPGDYILEVNGTNVATMSHEGVVDLIRQSGDMLAMKVLTVERQILSKEKNKNLEFGSK